MSWTKSVGRREEIEKERRWEETDEELERSERDGEEESVIGRGGRVSDGEGRYGPNDEWETTRTGV